MSSQFWNLEGLQSLEFQGLRFQNSDRSLAGSWVPEIYLHNWCLTGGWTTGRAPPLPVQCGILVPKSRPGHCSPHSPSPSSIEPSISQKTPLPLNTPSPGLSGLPVPAAWAHPASPRDDAELRQAQAEVPDRPLPSWGLNAAERRFSPL